MTTSNPTWIANYICGIPHDVARDICVRGKYRDAILHMTVLRCLYAVLEPTKRAVLAMKAHLDELGAGGGDTADDLVLLDVEGGDGCITGRFRKNRWVPKTYECPTPRGRSQATQAKCVSEPSGFRRCRPGMARRHADGQAFHYATTNSEASR